MTKRLWLDNAAVTATEADIAVLNVQDEKTMGVQILNGGSKALSVFKTLVQFHGDDAWYTIASSAGDYAKATSASITAIDSNVSPVTLAAAATVWLSLDVSKICAIKFRAKCAGTDTTTLDISAIAKV